MQRSFGGRETLATLQLLYMDGWSAKEDRSRTCRSAGSAGGRDERSQRTPCHPRARVELEGRVRRPSLAHPLCETQVSLSLHVMEGRVSFRSSIVYFVQKPQVVRHPLAKPQLQKRPSTQTYVTRAGATQTIGDDAMDDARVRSRWSSRRADPS
ncbi:hypothetical protein K466DRAFT_60144 [Polyporus arcularius HHB13444]|uniref:Uncharacterized protein n=1 Tax=Polyporus arcularius HHB13444 TaxID=1314778 RepID=A0A5C3Q5U6_9APHY|nr:hypothetical protein K466DRAFT_60144 [Polyporus arcularius HHB13444]